LANRTRKLIADLKPDSVLVQANQKWWNKAKYIEATAQSQMNTFHNEFYACFPKHLHNNPRG